MAVAGTLLALAAPALLELGPSRKAAAMELSGFLERARNRAMTSGEEVFVAFADGNHPVDSLKFRAYAFSPADASAGRRRPLPTFLSLEGLKFNRGEPIEVGGGSGTLALRPGKFTLKRTNAIAQPTSASIPIQIENGRTAVVVCYDEVKLFEHGSEEVKIRFSLLTEAPESEIANLTIVSLLHEKIVPLSLDPPLYRAAPKSPLKGDLQDRDIVAIRSENETRIDFESDRPGHYIVFLFDDPETGELAASLIQNEKLEYQPPLEETEEE